VDARTFIFFKQHHCTLRSWLSAAFIAPAENILLEFSVAPRPTEHGPWLAIQFLRSLMHSRNKKRSFARSESGLLRVGIQWLKRIAAGHVGSMTKQQSSLTAPVRLNPPAGLISNVHQSSLLLYCCDHQFEIAVRNTAFLTVQL
jgi:hypothetical protein